MMWPPCSFCGDPVYGLAADDGIHPCCAHAEANERTTCAACEMAKGEEPEPRVLTSEVVPVEEWDWDEIHRLEKAARRRLYANNPRCDPCTKPMVCGQTGAHITCRETP